MLLAKGSRQITPNPPPPPPTGDLVTFYDNNQVIGKTHHVSLNNKVRSSTITTAIHIPSRGQPLQQDPTLSPATWLTDFELNPIQLEQLRQLQHEAEALLGYGIMGINTYLMSTHVPPVLHLYVRQKYYTKLHL